MKKFFYYAFAVMTAMCMTACSSDDDNDSKKDNGIQGEVNLPTPKNADNAAQYTLATPMASVVTEGEEVNEDAPQLQTIDITESCELMLELRHPISGQVQYFKEKATFKDNIYTVNGAQLKGTVKVVNNAARLTRGGTTHLEVNLEVKFTETEVYTYTTEEGQTVEVTETKTMTGDEAIARLARTWTVRAVILELHSSDIDAIERWDATNGMINLETTVLKEALDRDVNLNEDEKDELRKTVKSITITGSNLLSIDYTNDNPDVATWQWANAAKTQIKIQLKDGKMGNKFIQDATAVDFEFYSGNYCNMTMATTFDDNSKKQWDVTLTVQMQSVE